jgi:phosphatidylserine/phosphatidylglycerophosphate/cardiolipin synthase-like enzyme
LSKSAPACCITIWSKAACRFDEYRRRPLHGKVALADDHWATVGSSNLDPLSLSLNLEANLIIHDRQFNQTLRDNLNGLIANDCQQVDKSMLPNAPGGMGISVLAFHFLRHFPAWSAGCRPIRRSWRGSARRCSQKLKLRIAGCDESGGETLMAKSHPRWRMAKKILTVFSYRRRVLLVVYAQKVDWQEVWKVIRTTNRMALLGAMGLVIAAT